MTNKKPRGEFFQELRKTLYDWDKYSTPSDLSRRATIESCPKNKERLFRMAKRRQHVYDIYKYLCSQIDDEGDCDDFNPPKEGK
jgi:hypothetical protein